LAQGPSANIAGQFGNVDYLDLNCKHDGQSRPSSASFGGDSHVSQEGASHDEGSHPAGGTVG